MDAKTLAIYLGCNCSTKYVNWTEWGHPITLTLSLLKRFEEDASFEIKPILRQLSSITEEEEEGWFDAANEVPKSDLSASIIREAVRTQYLLSKDFDLFGLIEKGEAIDGSKQ